MTNMPGKTFYETIVKGVIFGTLCYACFAVDGLLKLADDQIKLNKKLVSQLEDCEEELSKCEEKLSQCKETLN